MTKSIHSLSTATRMLQEETQGDFSRKFERACFAFSCSLAGHPLFHKDALAEQVMAAPRSVYFDMGDIRVDDRWGSISERKTTALDAIKNIHCSGAWVLLNHVERNPAYARILDQFFEEAEELSGQPFRRTSRSQEMIVFVTSPNRLTPYHIDRECNFLIQTSGAKLIHTFDGTDRAILSEPELERFWAFDKNGAKYSQSHQAKATSFELRPGDALHIPVNFPHWVQNGPEVSISVSISVQFHDHVRGNIYRANHFLRQLGITPSSPGRYPVRDALKGHLYATGRRLRKLYRRDREAN